MLKKCIFLLIFLFVLPTVAFAHTGIKNSTPSEGETVQQEVNEIVLNFEAAVEPSAGIDVTNSKGEKLPISVTVNGKMVKGTFNSPLPDDSYEVKWKITADDGDIIQGNYSFTVELPAPVATKQPEQSAQETVKPSPAPSESITPLPNPNTEKKTDSNSNSGVTTNIIAVIALFVIVVALGLLFILRRRRKYE